MELACIKNYFIYDIEDKIVCLEANLCCTPIQSLFKAFISQFSKVSNFERTNLEMGLYFRKLYVSMRIQTLNLPRNAICHTWYTRRPQLV